MADVQQVQILKKGVKIWNKWREEHPSVKVDLSDMDFSRANIMDNHLLSVNLRGANLNNSILMDAELRGAYFNEATLYRTNLNGANLMNTDFRDAQLKGTYLLDTWLWKATFGGADLRGASLSGASLKEADFRGADLDGASLYGANCYRTDFSQANLSNAILQGAHLEKTNFDNTILTGCFVYGTSVWDIEGIPKDQSNLIITPEFAAKITVDDLQVAQFIYLLLNNRNIRNIIDTITSKAVLILGRFTEERKAVLDAIREELRKQNFTPILFDFDKPASKDVTGTVETLARMARFIIADLTDPSSIPHELATIVPFLRTTPVLPIRLRGSGGYTMFDDLQRAYPWILKIHEYKDGHSFIAQLPEVLIPVNEMAEAFRKRP